MPMNDIEWKDIYVDEVIVDASSRRVQIKGHTSLCCTFTAGNPDRLPFAYRCIATRVDASGRVNNMIENSSYAIVAIVNDIATIVMTSEILIRLEEQSVSYHVIKSALYDLSVKYGFHSGALVVRLILKNKVISRREKIGRITRNDEKQKSI